MQKVEGRPSSGAAYLSWGQGLPPQGAEAIAAIHWAVAARAEGHHGVNAALGADCRVHLTLSAAIPTLLAPPGAPALGAALGFVGVSPGSEELLLPHREYERCPTFHASETLVRDRHLDGLHMMFLGSVEVIRC